MAAPGKVPLYSPLLQLPTTGLKSWASRSRPPVSSWPGRRPAFSQPSLPPHHHSVLYRALHLAGSQVWRVFSSSPVSRVELAAAGAAYQPAGTSLLGPALPTPILLTHLPTSLATNYIVWLSFKF